MKNLISIIALCFFCSGAFGEMEYCGTLKSVTKYKEASTIGGAIKFKHRVKFTNGTVIAPLNMTEGDQAFLAASLTNKLTVCFTKDDESGYWFSMAVK